MKNPLIIPKGVKNLFFFDFSPILRWSMYQLRIFDFSFIKDFYIIVSKYSKVRI